MLAYLLLLVPADRAVFQIRSKEQQAPASVTRYQRQLPKIFLLRSSKRKTEAMVE